MQQIALDLGLASDPSFNNYFAGCNDAILKHMQLWATSVPRSPVPTYLWGDHASGKTHLLQATCQALMAQGQFVGWLDAGVAEPPEFNPRWRLIVLDDVHLYTAVQQHAAFNWFVNAMTPQAMSDEMASLSTKALTPIASVSTTTSGEVSQCGILAAGLVAPNHLQLREDLRTRLGWGHVFELQVLSEPERRTVVQREAQARGIALPPEVMDFMLNRFSRDLGNLMQLLDQLDSYALQTKRSITIPLIKAMLESL